MQSVVTVDDEDEAIIIPESTKWASLYRPMELPPRDPNAAPTEIADSTPLLNEGETHSIPETPKLAHQIKLAKAQTGRSEIRSSQGYPNPVLSSVPIFQAYTM